MVQATVMMLPAVSALVMGVCVCLSHKSDVLNRVLRAVAGVLLPIVAATLTILHQRGLLIERMYPCQVETPYSNNKHLKEIGRAHV